MTVKAIDLLVEAKRIIRNPKKWIQGARCKDKRGIDCNVGSDDAYKFCASGAIVQASYNLKAHHSEFQCAIAAGAFRRAIGTDYITIFNDDYGRTHKEIMAAFTQAIGCLRKKGVK